MSSRLHATGLEFVDLNWLVRPRGLRLGFHDNSVDFQITPGAVVIRRDDHVEPRAPSVHLRKPRRTVPQTPPRIGENFFRRPGTARLWAEGTVSLSRAPWIESFCAADLSVRRTRARDVAPKKRGSRRSGAGSTTDSMEYARCASAGTPWRVWGRPLPTSSSRSSHDHNWFAEMLLKTRPEVGDTGKLVQG